MIFQGLHEFKPSPEIEFFFGFEVDREYPERLRWLLGYSWIDPQYRVENSIKGGQGLAQSLPSGRGGLFVVTEMIRGTSRVQYIIDFKNKQE